MYIYIYANFGRFDTHLERRNCMIRHFTGSPYHWAPKNMATDIAELASVVYDTDDEARMHPRVHMRYHIRCQPTVAPQLLELERHTELVANL